MRKISPKELSSSPMVTPARWQKQASWPVAQVFPAPPSLRFPQRKETYNSNEDVSPMYSNILLLFSCKQIGATPPCRSYLPNWKSVAFVEWITRSCTLWPSLLGASLWNQLPQHRSCSYQTLSWWRTSVAEPVRLVSFLVTNDCHYFPASQPWPGWYRSDGVWIEAAPVLGPWCMRKYSWSLLFSVGLSTGREVSTSWVRKDRWWLVERALKIRVFLVLLFFCVKVLFCCF